MNCPDSILGLPCRVWKHWGPPSSSLWEFIWIVDDKWGFVLWRDDPSLRVYHVADPDETMLTGNCVMRTEVRDKLDAYQHILTFLKEYYHEKTAVR